MEQHHQPSQCDAVETPHLGHAGLPIHGNEDMYLSVDQRPLYRDCTTAPEAKKLFLRWMEFNEKRINTLPYFSNDVDEEDWVVYRIQHALNMIEKEGWFWRHTSYTREDFIRELQDGFPGSDLEDCMMRTVSKLKENEDEQRFWKRYEKVMGYPRTPYEDLMEAFEKSTNEESGERQSSRT